MGLLVGAAKRLQGRLGGLVLLVHHSGKDVSKGPRGHSSLLAALDAALEVQREGSARRWKVTKAKDSLDGNEHLFQLDVIELGTDEHGEPVTSCVIEPDAPGHEVARRPPPVGNRFQQVLGSRPPCIVLAVPLPTADLPELVDMGKGL